MEPLVEVNNAEEMERALAGGATVIGINNRDLRSFNVDLGTTDRLAGMVSGGVLLAALSGISSGRTSSASRLPARARYWSANR